MALTIMRMPLQLEVAKKHAARGPATRRYDRVAALAYARAFWNRHCSDGYVAVAKKGARPYREADPGREFVIPGKTAGDEKAYEDGTDINGKPIPWKELNDCSHFTSCCIGRPYDALRARPMLKSNPRLQPADAPRLPAGGLNVPSVEALGNPWLYGIVGAPALVRFLTQPRVGRVIAEGLSLGDDALEAAVKRLETGDVIALAGQRGYSHVLLYDGEGHVVCHTRCRRSARWDFATEGAKYTCIHILDEIDE